jgi:hypothetical protein
MAYNDIKTFFVVLLAICGAVSVIGGAVNIILNWKKESRITRHDLAIKDHETRIRKLEDNSRSQDSFTKVLCNSVLALVSHEINGNSVDKLKTAQEELQDFLINK